MIFLEGEDGGLEDPVEIDESEEIVKKILDALSISAEEVLGLRKKEDVAERVVDVLEAAEAVAEPGGGRAAVAGGNNSEIRDVVSELGEERVRAAGKGNGSGVLRQQWWLGGWTVGIFGWER